MPEILAGIETIGAQTYALIAKTFRFDTDAQNLEARVRAYFAAVEAEDPGSGIQSIRAAGAASGPTFALTVIGSRARLGNNVPYANADIAFAFVTDPETQLDATLSDLINKIGARHATPAQNLILVREHILAGGSAGAVWLVGVLAEFVPPVP